MAGNGVSKVISRRLPAPEPDAPPAAEAGDDAPAASAVA
jgi:hypothetical protein